MNDGFDHFCVARWVPLNHPTWRLICSHVFCCFFLVFRKSIPHPHTPIHARPNGCLWRVYFCRVPRIAEGQHDTTLVSPLGRRAEMAEHSNFSFCYRVVKGGSKGRGFPNIPCSVNPNLAKRPESSTGSPGSHPLGHNKNRSLLEPKRKRIVFQ